MQQALQVYTDDGGRFVIARDDYRRYCDGLLRLARPIGGDVESVMRRVLQKGAPGAVDVAKVMAYFGNDLPAIQEIIKPLIAAIGQMLPGLDIWLVVTGFGDDKDFILALVNWQRVLTGTAYTSRHERTRMVAQIAAKLRADNAAALQYKPSGLVQ